MTPELCKVVGHGSGFLAVMPRPRGADWLEDELVALRRMGVDTIASLLESWEEADLELSEEAGAAERNGIEFLRFPIPDRGVPEPLAEFARFVRSLAQRVRSDLGVVVHCRAGIGRSGLTAAAILIALGYHRSQVFDLISMARGLRVPDTDEQIAWFEEHWSSFGD